MIIRKSTSQNFYWTRIDWLIFLIFIITSSLFLNEFAIKSVLATTYWGASNPWYAGGGSVTREWPPGSLYRAKGKTWGSYNGSGSAPVKVQVRAYQFDQNGVCNSTQTSIIAGSGSVEKWTDTKSVINCGGSFHEYWAIAEHWVGYNGSNQLHGSTVER